MPKHYFAKIGNSQVQLWDGKSSRCKRAASKLSEAKKLFDRLPQNFELWLVSVVPSLHTQLQRRFGHRLRLVGLKEIPLRWAYRKGLGMDRAINLYAASRLVSGPSVVIDYGTAITVDFLSKDRRHRGGWILPGPDLAGKALQRGTAQLPYVKWQTKHRKLSVGSSTQSCIAAGQYHYQQSILQYCQKFGRQFFRHTPKLVVTGGYSRDLQLFRGVYRDSLLSLKGLQFLANEIKMDKER